MQCGDTGGSNIVGNDINSVPLLLMILFCGGCAGIGEHPIHDAHCTLLSFSCGKYEYCMYSCEYGPFRPPLTFTPFISFCKLCILLKLSTTRWQTVVSLNKIPLLKACKLRKSNKNNVANVPCKKTNYQFPFHGIHHGGECRTLVLWLITFCIYF